MLFSNPDDFGSVQHFIDRSAVVAVRCAASIPSAEMRHTTLN